mmetsp:Transcript_35625/g.111112  ORF Transcript_35625/g.111112 Transcript_35625/m.111112 type:complete len:1029 (+) Transcript_35625:63-3149(+)
MAMKGIQEFGRGFQEALGFEPPKHMKGLQVFIADIRNCSNKEMEEKRVDKELAKIRQKFTNTKSVSGYDKKKYVWKLLYAYMLGYDVDFGHIQAVELCSSIKFSEKTAGYLAMSMLLWDNAEILRLVVNSVKLDMSSRNEHVAALALNTVANIGGSEFADNLFNDISKMLLSNSVQLSAYIKRKACICLLRLYRRDTDTLQPDLWRKRLVELLRDRDVGLLTSASGFVLAILEQGTFPIHEWGEVVPAVAQCLHNLVQGECPEHYEYYRVPAPWLQAKLLRILQFFPLAALSRDTDTHRMINVILHSVLTKPAAQRAPPPPGEKHKKRGKVDAERQNRSNAEHSILFEAMNLMIHLEDRCDPETTRSAAGLLGAFISSTDPNIRYLGLETMARLATNIGTHEHLERYQSLILEKMHETDISIRRQALNLLYALCRPENWQQIVDELLNLLAQSDPLLQEELVLKIAILAEKNAPHHHWYVDVVFRMLESAPDSVADDVLFRVVQVVTGFEDGLSETEKGALQRHAASKALQALTGQGGVMQHETLVKLGAYLVGEFGHRLPQNISPRAQLEALYKHFQGASPQTKSIIMLSAVKLLNANPEAVKSEVVPFLEELRESHEVEIQQRACELVFLTRDEDLLEYVLSPMPQYAETVQQNNPLIQRLKFQTKSRAVNRAQLEEAAKSEGGVFKQGVGGPRGLGPREGSDNGRMFEPPPRANGSGSVASGPVSSPEAAAGSGSESESGSESSEDSPEQRQADGAPGQNPRDLWQQLCIMPQGRLYTSGSLVLELKHDYSAETGRITVMFVNSSQEPIGNIRVMIPEVPFLRVQQVNQAPAQLGPGQQAPHYVQVQCVQPFLQPAKYLVEYVDGRGTPVQLPLMLPAVLTKFISPAEIQLQQFRQVFESCVGPPRESVVVGTPKAPPNQWPSYLTKGFNLYMLRESTPASAFAAGTLNTATPDPSQPGRNMSVPCMVRLEYLPDKNLTRLTVRTQHGEVTGPLSKIIETYLFAPGSQNGAQPNGGPPAGPPTTY